MGRDHTCHVRFECKNPHAKCKASSNYGKVVKALALLLGICAWYPPEKQQAVGNLCPPLPLRIKPCVTARPHKDSAKQRCLYESLPESFTGTAEWYEAADQRWSRSPHSVRAGVWQIQGRRVGIWWWWSHFDIIVTRFHKTNWMSFVWSKRYTMKYIYCHLKKKGFHTHNCI